MLDGFVLFRDLNIGCFGIFSNLNISSFVYLNIIFIHQSVLFYSKF